MSRPLRAALAHLQILAARFLLVTLILIGALCGVIAAAFHRYVEVAHDLLIGEVLATPDPLRIALIIIVPAVTFASLAYVIRRWAPRAVGANLARVRRAYNGDPRLLGPRTVTATFIATPVSLGAGAPLGPEGPIVVVASGVSVGVARLLRLPRKVVRAMIPIGTAAGISAVFNTPITGVVFAIEEVIGNSQRGILGGVLLGSVAAAVVERQVFGGRPLLAAPFSTWSDPRELLGFALLGLIAGVTSGFAIKVAHHLKQRWTATMPSIVGRAGTAGLLIGLAGVTAPEVLGVGYDSVSLWLHGGGTGMDAGLAFALKLLAFVLAISAGVIGGTFAPSLFIGTALGAALGHAAHELFPGAAIDPKAYAIVGMGSFFAGLLRSPISAVLIVVELTRGYELILPLMLAVSLAVATSRRISRLSMVEQQMIDEGDPGEYRSEEPRTEVTAADAMTGAVVSIEHEATLSDAAQRTEHSRHAFYPVTADGGKLKGIASREAIKRAVRQGRGDEHIDSVLEAPPVVASAGDRLIDVLQQMQVRGVDRCPVVETHTSQRLVGFLTRSDILRARQRHHSRHDEPFELFG